MIDFILHPLTYAFMERGLLAAVMVGILCSVVGCYVVLRSMAFLGDAMAHAILPGIAIAYLVKGNLSVGALLAAVIVALGIGAFSQHGTMFTAALALGIALISSIRTYAVDLSHILFGNVLGVSSNDLLLTAILGTIILTVTLICYKPFLVITFDPLLANILRLPVTFLRNLLLVLLALTIVTSMQTVGVGLVAAMLVTPGATAYLLTKRLPAMMALAAVFGAFASLIGLYISYYLNIASGSTIVLTATSFFLLAFLFSPRKGLLKNWGRK
jgi:manganese/iron transport system permease protein